MIMQEPTIHGKYHGETGCLLGNFDMGILEFVGMGNHEDYVQMMMSRGSCTNQSHTMIAQNDHTNQDDVTSKNGNDKQLFRMIQSNSAAYGGPETG